MPGSPGVLMSPDSLRELSVFDEVLSEMLSLRGASVRGGENLFFKEVNKAIFVQDAKTEPRRKGRTDQDQDKINVKPFQA